MKNTSANAAVRTAPWAVVATKVGLVIALGAAALGIGGCDSQDQCLNEAYDKIAASSLKEYTKGEMFGFYHATKTRTREDMEFLARIRSDADFRNEAISSDVFRQFVDEGIIDANRPCDADFLVIKMICEFLAKHPPGLD